MLRDHVAFIYTPVLKGPSLAMQNRLKLGVFDRKLEGTHYLFHCYSNEYMSKCNNSVDIIIVMKTYISRYRNNNQ